jgi:hypothetical protein
MSIPDATSDALAAKGREDVCGITYKDGAVVKPFIDDLLRESKGSTPQNVDAFRRKRDGAARQELSAFVGITRQRRS